MNTPGIEFGRKTAAAYAALCKPLCQKLHLTQTAFDILMFLANNPKGADFHYYLPWVKITPNGDYAMKGDEWQQIPFSLEALKPVGGPAILMDGVPVYS